MRKFLLLIIIVFLAGCKTSSDMVSSARYFDTGGRTTYQDKDWNIEFYDNCGLPESSSVRWVTEGKETFLRFTLKNKQVGGCGTDGIQRHGAPYWERAEIKQASTLAKNTDYTLTFKVRFVKGFSYPREDFFQMHQSVAGCRVGPPMMFKFSYGHFTPKHWAQPLKRKVHINEVIGKWVNVKLEVIFTESYYNLYFNDEKIIDEGDFGVDPCGEPHFKFGVYRPGDEEATGERISILDIDKIQLVKKKKK
ncbi:MAG: heparin lyase I family protein [Nitrospinae bacterium]|nr:heparin lyase I family protein [Nitrospinota bacterium]